MNKQITLLMPECIPSHTAFLSQDFPYLSKILSQSCIKSTNACSHESQLLNLFSLQKSSLPVAALIAFNQGLINQNQSQSFCCVDFVHFKTDAHTAYLKKCLNEELSLDESKILINEVEQLMLPDHCYITTQQFNVFQISEQFIDITVNSIWDVLGKSLLMRLPSGPGAAKLHRLMTEIQMLLSSNAINVQRRINHLMTVDGVWIWGGGQIPREARAPFDLILSDEPYIRGLAKLAGISCLPLEELSEINAFSSRHILVVDTHLQSLAQEGEIEAWQLAMEQYEIKYFKRMQKMLVDKQCSAFHLNACNGKIYSSTPARMRFFWRRHKTLASFCDVSYSY